MYVPRNVVLYKRSMISIIKNVIASFAKEMSSATFGQSAQTDRLLLSLKMLGRRAGYVVDYPGESKNTAWLYDQTWLNFEKTGRKRLLGVELAFECEWDPNRDEVMKDFNKLLQSRAKIKVLVCHDPYGGLAQNLKDAVSLYPGIEPCSYLFAVCDFENNASPVVFIECDEKGLPLDQKNGLQSLLRSLRTLGNDIGVVTLEFEGFWPNRRNGFEMSKPGLYFVFAGIRKQTATGYVADLKRTIFIGMTADVSNLARGEKNVFEGFCQSGEIPYFAFAKITTPYSSIEECLMALTYKFSPVINSMHTILHKPSKKIAFSMIGDVAGCLGDRTFIV